MSGDHDSDHDHDHDHDHDGHDHRHGHADDRGLSGALRYMRRLPRMWRSAVNDAVVDHVSPRAGERVVDIGAGMGAGAMRAARRGATVIAVEPTPFMRGVLTARRLCSRHRGNVDVVDGAAELLPVDDASIDAVWAVNTMHHWVDQERGAAEIARVLRPDGRFVLVDEDFTDPSHPDHDRFGSEDDDGHHHGFTMVDANRIGGLLRSVGLVEIDGSRRELADRPVIAVSGRAPC